jgi:hypothetical protein
MCLCVHVCSFVCLLVFASVWQMRRQGGCNGSRTSLGVSEREGSVCVCECLSVFVCVYVHVCVCICVFASACMCVYLCVCVCLRPPGN